jgi:hypothetical protein
VKQSARKETREVLVESGSVVLVAGRFASGATGACVGGKQAGRTGGSGLYARQLVLAPKCTSWWTLTATAGGRRDNSHEGSVAEESGWVPDRMDPAGD